MKKVMKKIASVFTITSIAVSMLCAMPIVQAEVLINSEMNGMDGFLYEKSGPAMGLWGEHAEIIAEPGNDENNVFAITVPAYGKSSDGWYAWQHLLFPYNDLAEDENLKISYRFKDVSGLANLFWVNFGTVTAQSSFSYTPAELSPVLQGLRYDYDPGFCQVYERADSLNFVGFDNNEHTYTVLARDDVGQKGVSADASGKTGWWTVTYIFDRTSEMVNIKIVNEDGTNIEDFVYTINELPTDGYLRFDVRPSLTLGNPESVVYIDDVKIETWKPMEIEETNITETDFDAQEDIEITFSNEVADFAAIKRAVTITEADGTVVEEDRITVTGSGDVATVNVEGGLKYGKTTYTLTLDENIIESVDGLKLTEPYSQTFTTKLGKSVYISSVTALDENSTTVTITNPENSEKDVWVILALYSSTNKFIGYAEGELTSIAADTTTDPITLTATNVNGTVSSAVVLLCDRSTSLIPYHIPVIVYE